MSVSQSLGKSEIEVILGYIVSLSLLLPTGDPVLKEGGCMLCISYITQFSEEIERDQLTSQMRKL